MKLTTLILMVSLMQVSAATFGQKITLNQKNVSLKTVLKEIRKQSGYDIYYDGKLISDQQKLDVNFKNTAITEILDYILAPFSMSYQIREGNITIRTKENRQLTVETSIPTSVEVAPIEIKGTVVDALVGNPLIGASIRVKGSLQATVTDQNGEFTLTNIDEKAILLITYTGYIPREISASKNLGKIKMDVSISNINSVDVVNTGYQHIKPTQVTGSMASLGTKEYESRISTDFLSGLVNKLPGLVINPDVKFTSNNYGVTNQNGLFNIRGLSTITGNQNPLIVLDGYPTELSLNDINPNEIKGVTILKDAAAAAIYGVRAANGVIIVDRKQANVGSTRFAFRSTLGIKPKEDYSNYRWAPDHVGLDYLKNINFANYPWILYSLYGLPINPGMALYSQQAGGIITQDQFQKGLEEMASYNNADDYSRLFTRTAATQQYNLNITGGTEKALYYFTIGYLDNNPNQINNRNNQFQLSGRTTFNFTKKLGLELTTEYLERGVRSSPVPNINQFYSYERFQDSNGNPLSTFMGSNINLLSNKSRMDQGYLDNLYYPLVDINEIRTKTRTVDNRVTANFKYLIGNGFRLSFGGIYERSNTDQDYYASDESSATKQYINRYTDATTNPFTRLIPNGSYQQQTDAKLRSYTLRAQLDYNKYINKDHSINAIIGAEVRGVVNQLSSTPFFGYNEQTLISQAVDFKKLTDNPPGSVYFYNPTLSYSQLFSQTYTDDRYVSGYFNAVYSFKEKYSVTSSIRFDQSNLFGQDPKYRYRPLWSVGGAWNIDRENFMSDVRWVNSLKMRVAHGLSGNVAKTSLPQIVANATLNNVTLTNTPSLTLLTPANSGLRWEKTSNFNAGIDYRIFKNISGSVDYYIKKSTDLLGNTQTDATKGISSALVNQATIRNQGLEINLQADWISRPHLNWNTGFSFARNTSKVLDIYEDMSYFSGTAPVVLRRMASGYIKDYPIGQMFSYRYAGLNQAGVPLVYDPQGNAIQLNTNTNPGIDFLKDEGSYIPRYNIGLSNRLDIGNFYFYAMLNFYTGFRVRTPYPTPNAIRPISGAENFWTKAGDELNPDVVAGNLDGTSSIYYANIIPYLDKYTVNGAYMTLGDLTVSYNFAKAGFVKKMGFNNFEVKMQASNVYTKGFNKYNYSQATGSFEKNYLTPTYTIGLFTNF